MGVTENGNTCDRTRLHYSPIKSPVAEEAVKAQRSATEGSGLQEGQPEGDAALPFVVPVDREGEPNGFPPSRSSEEKTGALARVLLEAKGVPKEPDLPSRSGAVTEAEGALSAAIPTAGQLETWHRTSRRWGCPPH